MKQLFQCAILFHKRDENGKVIDTVFIMEPIFKLAKSEKELLFSLTREIPEEYIENPDDIQIIIKNF